MKQYEDIILPVDMSTLSVKAKHGTDPPLHLSSAMRRKVSPMYTTDMTRAKTINNIEEQQLNKKLRDLEKQQSKIQSEMLQMKATLLPEIKVTAACEDKTPNGVPVDNRPSPGASGQGNSSTGSVENLTGEYKTPPRGRSGSLPPLAIRKEAERVRLGESLTTASTETGVHIVPTPPSGTGGIRRVRSMNEIDGGRPSRVRPQSAHCTAAAALARRRSIPRSQSLNSSTESLPSDLPKSTRSPSSSPAASTEDVSRPRAQTVTALLPLRKAKSTTTINQATRTRRVTMDSSDLTRLDKDSIFKNSSYNPVLLNPSPPRAANGGRQRRATSPMRLSHLSPDAPAPAPPRRSDPSLEDQFEQLKACRYLRVPSEDSDQDT